MCKKNEFLNRMFRKTFVLTLLMLALLIAPAITAAAAMPPLSAINPTYADAFPDVAFRAEVLTLVNRSDYGARTGASEVTGADMEFMAGWDFLNVSNKGIADMTGIEYFKRLIVLFCSDNQLTALDLSNNTMLENVVCSGNMLTALDVSKNINLIELHCNYNRLTSLVLAQNTALVATNTSNISAAPLAAANTSIISTALAALAAPNAAVALAASPAAATAALTTLNCGHNALTSIDVTKCPLLDFFACDENLLTSLDITMNPLLRSFLCTGNQLNSLNTTSNPNLTEMWCSNNNLAALDLSQNINLTNLECTYNQLTALDLSSNPRLVYLWCNSNMIETLDLSANTLLNVLGCSYNRIASLDVANCGALASLACRGNVLSALNIADNTNLINLECDYNNLTSLNIANNPILESLSCSANLLTALDLTHNPELVDLWCGTNQIQNLNLANNTKLKILWCPDNRLTDLNLPQSSTLKELYCSQNMLTELDVGNFPELTLLLCQSNNLVELDISQNPLLVDFYCSDNSLTDLDVSANTILNTIFCDRNELKSLDLSNNTRLEALNCFANQLIELDVSVNILLNYLECGNNALITLRLPPGETLLNINCSLNDLTELDVSQYVNLFGLNCGGNRLTSLDVTHNPELIMLWCGWNDLTELDVSQNTSLYDLSCANNALQELDISKNPYLVNFDCSNNLLTELDISANVMINSLSCEYNYLTELDVTDHAALRALYCRYNNLESFNDVKGWQELGLIINDPDDPSSPDKANFFYYNQRGSIAPVITITKQPEDCRVFIQEGVASGAYLEVEATVEPYAPATYYWYIRRGPLPILEVDTYVGEGTRLVLPPALAPVYSSGYVYYYCYITAEGALPVISDAAEVSYSYVIVDPGVEIVTQPAASTEVLEGEITQNLFVDARPIGNTTVSYQWYESTVASNEGGTPIPGAVGAIFFIPAGLTADDGPYYYYCVVYGGIDVLRSDVATVFVKKEVTGTTFAEAFPDPGFLQAVLDMEEWNGERSGDDYISAADMAIINNRNACDIAGYGVSDLTGIELFRSITWFRATGNLLTEMDLSANTALNFLYANGNLLTEIDLSNNTELRELRLDENRLTSLDLSALVNLRTMSCDRNRLTELDLTGLNGLLDVSCNTNPLEEIRVAGLPILEILGCGSNSLTELNLTGLDNLAALYCDNNLLTELDVGGLGSLQLLWCYNNLLTGLDVSNNLMLGELHCEGNNMESPDDVAGWEALGLTINSPDNLWYGSFRFYEQNGSGAAYLANLEIISVPAILDYDQGDRLDITGLDVMAIYSDGTTANVVDYVTIDPPHGAVLDEPGMQVVSVSYEERGINLVRGYVINVKEGPGPTPGPTPGPKARVSITGPAAVETGEGVLVEYKISAEDAPLFSAVELQIEVDAEFLSFVEAGAIGDFVLIGAGGSGGSGGSGAQGSPIVWTHEDNIWSGKITLLNLGLGGGPGNFGASGDVDIINLVFRVIDNILGETEVKLKYVILSHAGSPVESEIVKPSARTVITERYSPFDLTKDGVINLNDLSFALQFLFVERGDPNWDAAKVVDFNDDDVIDMEDLVLIMANYTNPYYG